MSRSDLRRSSIVTVVAAAGALSVAVFNKPSFTNSLG